MGTDIRLEFEFRGQRFRDAQKGLEALGNELGRAANRITPLFERELKRYLDAVRQALIDRHSKPFQNPTNAPATGEKNLLKRSGGITGIKTEVRGRTQGGLDTVVGALTIPFPISVHEKGATIRAKSAQFLTIPLPAALDSRGIPLKSNARAWRDTFVQTSRRGNLLIFQRRGARITPLYLLKRSVTLPPRLKAEETLKAGEDFFVDSVIDTMAKQLLE